MYTIPPTLGLVRIVDHVGRLLVPSWSDDDNQPEPGSVVVVEGPHGTAFQRQFSDGRWHRAGPRPESLSWSELITKKRRVFLVYAAEPRP